MQSALTKRVEELVECGWYPETTTETTASLVGRRPFSWWLFLLVIVFFPIEGTAGPSTGGEIVAGRYDVPAAKGPRAGGTYRVEITASGTVRLYSPDVGAAAPAVPVREQIIPRRFNIETSLRADVRDDPDGHRQDFLLE